MLANQTPEFKVSAFGAAVTMLCCADCCMGQRPVEQETPEVPGTEEGRPPLNPEDFLKGDLWERISSLMEQLAERFGEAG